MRTGFGGREASVPARSPWARQTARVCAAGWRRLMRGSAEFNRSSSQIRLARWSRRLPGAIILAMRSLRVVSLMAALVWSAFWGPAPALSQGKGESQGSVTVSFVATGTGAESLSAGDVKLSVDGKDQSIASLKKVAQSGSATDAKLPPHTFSNRSEGAGSQNVVVILLDGVNTQWKDDAATRQATLAALQQVKPDERVAIFVFGKTLQMLARRALQNSRISRLSSRPAPAIRSWCAPFRRAVPRAPGCTKSRR